MSLHTPSPQHSDGEELGTSNAESHNTTESHDGTPVRIRNKFRKELDGRDEQEFYSELEPNSPPESRCSTEDPIATEFPAASNTRTVPATNKESVPNKTTMKRISGRPSIMKQISESPRSSGVLYSPSSAAKRRKREQEISQQHKTQRIQAESFVMKLFDRSLDLSKYTEKTALYPICRAWMANQPRNPNTRNYRDERVVPPPPRQHNAVEIISKLRSGDITEITSMPVPQICDGPLLQPVDLQCINKPKSLDVDVEKWRKFSREEMLAMHKAEWKTVKTKWITHMRKFRQNFKFNYMILEAMHKTEETEGT